MINQERFIHRFKELVAIPNSSREEAAMCDYLKKALTALSIPLRRMILHQSLTETAVISMLMSKGKKHSPRSFYPHIWIP